MNLLFFHLEVDFGKDLILVANNEVDLKDHLAKKGYSQFEFSDLQTTHGTCSMRDRFNNRETAKCFYIPKIV